MSGLIGVPVSVGDPLGPSRAIAWGVVFAVPASPGRRVRRLLLGVLTVWCARLVSCARWRVRPVVVALVPAPVRDGVFIGLDVAAARRVRVPAPRVPVE